MKKPKKSLRKQLAEARAELRDYERLFELQHRRVQEANRLWQEKHARPNTWPDLGELVGWLTKRGERWAALIAAARAVHKNAAVVIEEVEGKRYCAIKPKYLAQLDKALAHHDLFWGNEP